MGKYHNDKPIQGGASDPDLLNRESFAQHLANILLLDPNNDCLTVSLEGEWGYGKTSVISLIKTSLQAKETPPIIIEYNPWVAGNSESLIQDFLIQFSSQLNITHGSEETIKAAEKLISYSSLFGVAKLIPGAEPWASIIESVVNKTGNAAKDIAKLKKLDLLDKKNKVIKALKKIDSPIVVFIDDIDRLTPDETFQVLRLVKAIADFPGTSFLLAFDPKYLYQSLTSHNIENANEYIDKIIQLRVSLPIISDRDMHNLSERELAHISDKNLTEGFEQDQERLSWVYHKYVKHLIKNPRELKRFFNHLRFVIEQVEGQVCFTDLYCLSAIAIKANDVYTHIKARPQAYVGKSFAHDGPILKKPKEIVESLKKERDTALQSLSPDVEKIIRGILMELFPLIEEDTYNPQMFSVTSNDAAGRVSALQRLYVAFHFATPTGYISDSDMLSFIKGNMDRREFIEKTIKDKSVDRFFEMMYIYSESCKNEVFDILCAIYDAHISSEELAISLKANIGFMDFNVLRQITWLTDELISKSEQKETLLNKIISRKENVYLSADLINIMRSQINEHQKGNTHKDLWVESKSFLDLEQIFAKVAIKTLQQKLILNPNMESHVFYELIRSSIKKVSRFLKNLLDEKEIIRIAEIIQFSGSDSTNGPYVHIKKEFYEEIIDFELLQKEATLVLKKPSTLPISIKAALKSICDGEGYYLRDGKKTRR